MFSLDFLKCTVGMEKGGVFKNMIGLQMVQVPQFCQFMTLVSAAM